MGVSQLLAVFLYIVVRSVDKRRPQAPVEVVDSFGIELFESSSEGHQPLWQQLHGAKTGASAEIVARRLAHHLRSSLLVAVF